ncbi:TetR/AcrR family transcriptional regulator [uncultured Desulfosarcina sp.]|uniref:TetR/AcrR family transcriptional regulator n=1 Tax=uncultured Desulfosarcina sp. TaxID=218289 RepID=UPI0029C8F6A5|nr:TetR/AcrR family transcriptional regulator [uncultured Desulfosarcina sp.]
MNIHSERFVSGRFAIVAKKKNMAKYQRILDAAISVFAEQGFFQSTIAQIAKEAGVADGTIYLYFKNKDDILIQFYQYKTRQIFERFREAVSKPASAEEKLRCLIRVHLQEFQEDRNMAIVYQAETHQNRTLGTELIKEMSKMYRDLISEIVELGQEEGSIRRDLYMGLVKRFINGAVDEVINSWIHSGGKYDLVTMADPLVDLFIMGIGVNRQ